MDDVLLTCENVSFGYNGHAVVRNVSFTVRPGDYLCIAGENGSGKSTLLKGLLSLINPLEGTIVFSPTIRAADRGYLSQTEGAKKDFPADVGEVVLSGMTARMGLRPFYTRREKETALENLKLLDALDLKNRCFRELSGGQQRRVLIARALCAARKLLFLDEPAAGLDPLATGGLYEALSRLNREAGVTIVMVTHDIEGAVKHASHVLHLGAAFAKAQRSPGELSPPGQNYFFGPATEYAPGPRGQRKPKASP